MICFFIEGGFDAWTKWSTCTKLCGGGTQDRARVNSCTNEVQTGRQNCNTQPCTSSVTVVSGSQGNTWSSMISGKQIGSSYTNGGVESDDIWENWSEWGPCSVTCGGGFVVSCNLLLLYVTLNLMIFI